MRRTVTVWLTLIATVISTGCAPPAAMTPTPMPLEIRMLDCPEALTLGPTESYEITFQVLENGQPAQAGIVVNFLVGDANPEVSPREATTNEQGRVGTTVSPIWQSQRQQSITIGAMILPQRVGASCTTEVQLESTPMLPTTIPPTPMPLEIRVLECPEALTLGLTESYGITFQVLENGQPAQAGIVVNFLVGDANPEVSPREATTDEQGRVGTTVSPIWQSQRQQSITIGAMILPQRVGASCTTEVQLNP